MYELFYSLTSDPFRLLPDPGVCFPHRSSSRAWAYLQYALKRGEGIVVVTGQPGSGKTTLSERLLRDSNPSKTVAVRLVPAEPSAADLLRKLAYAMGLPVEDKDRSMLSLMLERHLYDIERSQRRVLIVIDEAQTLTHHSLEAMRLLTDLQVQGKPVAQLVLFGQEELEGVMCAPGMEQFQQRVVAGCRLEPMDLAETKSYIEYRLAASGWRGDPGVNGPAVLAIFRYSRGVPRHVNKICSRLFLHGSSEDKHALTDRDVRTVVGDLRSELLAPSDDDLPLKGEASGGVFDSVYELALVPSAAPRASTTPGGQHLPCDAQSEPAATITQPETGDAAMPPDSMRKAARPAAKKSYSRSGSRRRRSSFALSETIQWVRQALSDGRDFLGQWMRLSAYRDALSTARMHVQASVGKLRASVHQRWPEANTKLEDALRGSPFGGTLTTVGVGVVGLIAVIATFALTANDESVLEPGNSGVDLVSGVAAQQTDSAFILDGTQYMGVQDTSATSADSVVEASLAIDAAESDVNVELVDTGLETGDGGSTLRSESSTNDEAAAMARQHVSPIGLKVASGVVAGLTRYDSSLGVWAVARDAAPRRNSDSLRLVGTEQAESLEQSDEQADAVASVEQQPMPEAPTVAAVEQEKDMTIVIMNGEDSQFDFVRFLPATAAGISERGRRVEPAPLHAIAPALPQVLPAEIEIVEGDDLETVKPVLVAQAPQVAPVETGMAQPGEPSVEIDAAADVSGVGAEVTDLLNKAEASLSADRLLMPEKRSAFTYYTKVLQLDAGNSAAAAGLTRIAGRYAALAHEALGNQEFERAERFVTRGLRVDPADPKIRGLQSELEMARAEAAAVALAEAQMARVAAEVPVVEPEIAPKRAPSYFRQIMNLANGL